MTNIIVEFNRPLGKVKPVNGVGQPPFIGTDFSYVSYLKEANIPYSRLHDVGGAYGGNVYVDIPNLFREFDADPENPESYDFAFTDRLIAALVENNVEPFFRLGVTIENYVNVKAYRIFPPKDYLKWAKICEGVIRHYTEGWANGFNYDIKYWEIWNEPDNFEEIDENQMWRGTKEQYYELYDVAATYLKDNFPHLKIGGYASCGFYAIFNETVAEAKSSPRFDYFITFFDGFLDYIKEHNSPFDFFSWHSYSSISKNIEYAKYARKRLDDAGYKDVETICNEWNYSANERGTLYHAANNTAMLIAFQHSVLDSAMFYDANLGRNVYGSMFNPMTTKPFPLYYGFKAFGELYRLGTEVYSYCDSESIYVLSATNGKENGILIVNTGKEEKISLTIDKKQIEKCVIIDEKHTFEEVNLPDVLSENSILYICASN